MAHTAHVSDDLPTLLTGDATREVVLQAAAHLRDCVDCQQELVSAVIAHASLTSAHRFAPEIVSPEMTSAEPVGPEPPAEPAPLPDLSALFADVRSDSEQVASVAAASRRTGRWLIAVAAAAVVVGGGVTAYVLTTGDTAPAGRTVALAGDTTGQVRLADDSRMIVSTKLPAPADGDQYEVWLTGAEGGRQAIGYLHDGGGEMRVPEDVMRNYEGIAVSVQRNAQSAFSGKVVLAGRYG